MAFFQTAPTLSNSFLSNRLLKGYLRRLGNAEQLPAAFEELEQLASIASGSLQRLQQQDRQNEPRLTQWGPWGRRIDRIELTATWHEAAKLAAQYGLVATAYEKDLGSKARLLQFAKVYLFDPSSDTYTCPLAMTDGAAKTLLHHGNDRLLQRAFGHLTSRDPAQMWTSGQWMTERTGGSDVGASETVAKPVEDSANAAEGSFRLYGTKWFTSAATSQIALTLARLPQAPPGSKGLTLFYLETTTPQGQPNAFVVNRLKDKLGTRKLPTAELELQGSLAWPVTETGNGIRHISPMLNVTRTWNAVCSVAHMRRAIDLAVDYAHRRKQFGSPLADKPLHLRTLASLEAEHAAAFALAFRVVELLGTTENAGATSQHKLLLRVLTPIAKLLTAKQSVRVISEALECFGGAGYVEDAGISRLLRDAQVFPIWEGTTNVLSLDLLRALRADPDLDCIAQELARSSATLQHPALIKLAERCAARLAETRDWLSRCQGDDAEAAARQLALRLGQLLQLALLSEHADWALRQHNETGTLHAALLYEDLVFRSATLGCSLCPAELKELALWSHPQPRHGAAAGGSGH